MEKNEMEPVKTTRRELLKKTGKTVAFVLPLIVSFNISDLKAHASLPAPPAPPPPLP